jgi:hypothetical protein
VLNLPTQRTYRLVVLSLVGISAITLAVVVAALAATRPATARQAAATLTAALPRHTATPLPTPIPTLPGVSPELLLCQRRAGQAMHDRQMVGAVNLADDRTMTVVWVSRDWSVSDLDSALAGVISGLDLSLEVWQSGCTVYDWVAIEVYDREGSGQVHRLTVTARMSDVLGWRLGKLDDATLIAGLEVEQIAAPTP